MRRNRQYIKLTCNISRSLTFDEQRNKQDKSVMHQSIPAAPAPASNAWGGGGQAGRIWNNLTDA